MIFVLQNAVKYFFADLIRFVDGMENSAGTPFRRGKGPNSVEFVFISLSLPFSSCAEIYSRSYEQYKFDQTMILSA